MELHEAGGGINFTVEKTRSASEDELLGLLMTRLQRMLKAGNCYNKKKNCILRGYKPQVVMAFLCLIGTTTVECKSGYGLEAETEIKMLTVIQKAKRNLPIEIASTFLGAHSVPK